MHTYLSDIEIRAGEKNHEWRVCMLDNMDTYGIRQSIIEVAFSGDVLEARQKSLPECIVQIIEHEAYFKVKRHEQMLQNAGQVITPGAYKHATTNMSNALSFICTISRENPETNVYRLSDATGKSLFRVDLNMKTCTCEK